MSPESQLALLSFCTVSSITPGPNNMMLLASGATFGFRRTIPHIGGIIGGCMVMVLLLGWGLAGAVAKLPLVYSALHWISTLYLLWLAWRIATARGVGSARANARPQGFLGAASFQWVNPKAWAMTLGAITNFARPGHIGVDVALIAATLAMISVPCISLWAGCGVGLKRLLTHPAASRCFNVGMAVLLVLSLLPGLWRELAPRFG